MEKKGKISQYRERLDKTLASPELTNEETLKTLVKNQLLRSSQDGVAGCSESIQEKKTAEVFNFLDMLRSASVNDNEVSKSSEGSRGEWKLKQDTEEFRVMYREGPEGTPLHSLLVEGYVEGPLDACLCVSWESNLYKKWWPQYNFPPFKITISKCLQKVRICEEISLVRMKITWPLSAREAVVHYFMFEFFQDDLVVVLINTIDDVKSIDRNTHGFTNDGIPEAKDVVRIDLVGGFALQKVTRTRSYFRTIAHMDVKLDFVPPSLINFISRQLIGSGFRLYQKAVASVCNHSEEYRKPLEKPLYAQIREALYSKNESNEILKAKELKNDICVLPKDQAIEDMQDVSIDMEQNVHNINQASEYLTEKAPVTDAKVVSEFALKASEPKNGACIIPEEHLITGTQDHLNDIEQNVLNINHANESLRNKARATDRKAVSEIEEEQSEGSKDIEEGNNGIHQSLTNKIPEKWHENGKRNVSISPRVRQALETLEKAIYMVREYGFNGQTKPSIGLIKEKPPNMEVGEIKDSNCSENVVCKNVEVFGQKTMEKTSNELRNSSAIQDVRRSGSNSYSREVNHNRIAPASPEKDLSKPGETNQVLLSSSQNGTTITPILYQTMNANKQTSTEANGIHENNLNGITKMRQQRKHRLCCFFGNYSS